MSNPDEQRTSFIPPNFIEKGKILNGTFDIRNAIEAIIFALLIGVPVVHLPFSLTTRIIILCMTALPAAMVSLIGIGGESITAFLMNALRFLKKRRVVYRSDAMPEPKKKRQKQPARKKQKSLPNVNGGRKRKRALWRILPLLRGPVSRTMHLPRKRRPSRICPAPLPPLLLGKRNGKRNGSQRFVSINPSIPPPGGASAGRPEKIFGS